MIKLNNYQVCYISTSSDYTLFKFVTFTLYNSDKSMYIRYYEIKMWEKYQQKIYLNIKATLYNNFISVAYSHCPQTECNSNTTHYSSLIIFNYPNSTDNSLNIIPELYYSNKNIENDFSFNFEGKINIENNLFGFVYKGTKIMNIPTGLYLRNTTK